MIWIRNCQLTRTCVAILLFASCCLCVLDLTPTISTTPTVSTEYRWANRTEFYGTYNADLIGKNVAFNRDGSVMVTGSEINSLCADVGGVLMTYMWNEVDDAWDIYPVCASATSFNYEYLGSSVAINADGTIIAGGAIGAPLGGRVLVFRYDSTSQTWELYGSPVVYPGSGTTVPEFGHAVALDGSGNVLAVSAFDYLGDDGSIFVFHHSSTSGAWERTADFSPGLHEFGASISLSEDGKTLVVGAPGANSDGGIVYVILIKDIKTVMFYSIQGDSTVAARLGTAVGTTHDGSLVFATAPGDGYGKVYTFTYAANSDAWVAGRYFPVGNASLGGLGGESFAMSRNGTLFAAGSSFYEYVCLFRLNASSFDANHQGQFIDHHFFTYPERPGISFGTWIAITADESKVAIGSPESLLSQPGAGIVSVMTRKISTYHATALPSSNPTFKVTPTLLPTQSPTRSPTRSPTIANTVTSTWTQRGQTIVGPESGSLFGTGLHLNAQGDRLLVGSPYAYYGNGGITEFDYDDLTDTWSSGTDLAGGNTAVDNCGFDVAASEDSRIIVMSCPVTDSGVGKVVYLHDGSVEDTLTGTVYGGMFGANIRLSRDGTVLAVSVPYSPNLANSFYHCGIAYVYRMSNGQWGMPVPLDGLAGDNAQFPFVENVNMLAMNDNGTVIAVSGVYSTYVQTNGGLVRTYKYNEAADSWYIFGGDTLYGTEENEEMGMALALNGEGDIFAISSVKMSSQSEGCVYIFRLDSTWKAYGSPICGTFYEQYLGTSLSLNRGGDVLVMGARRSSSTDNKGAVRIYQFDSLAEEWVLQGQPLVGAEDSLFGSRVAVSDDGTIIAVAAPKNASVGAVYVYSTRPSITQRPTSQPSSQPSTSPTSSPTLDIIQYTSSTEFKPRGSTLYGSVAGERLGGSISLTHDGSMMALGGYGAIGEVYIRVWDGSDWHLRQVIVDTSPYAPAYFGYVVKLSGDGSRLVVSAPKGGYRGSGTVTTYAFNGTHYHQDGVPLEGQRNGDYFGQSLALSDDGKRLIVGAHHFMFPYRTIITHVLYMSMSM